MRTASFVFGGSAFLPGTDNLPPPERTWDQTGSDIISPGRNMGLDRKWHHTTPPSPPWTERQTHVKQECIPVGCVPTAC